MIDTGIASPQFNDFYIIPVPPHPNQGAASPTRFIVALDENKFTPDDIQTFTNQMCYGYYNWAGPIRVPAPCKYAHRLAYLFGKHIGGLEGPHANLNGTLFFI